MIMNDACYRMYGSPHQWSVMEVRWMPPPSPFVKINCDGSSLGNPSLAGFGVVLHSLDSGWIYGFSGFCCY